MKKVNWKPFVMFGLMIVIMFAMMTLFGSMFGGMMPMASSSEGPGMWMLIFPFAGMLVIMFFFFRVMTRGGGPMSMMGHRDVPQSQSEQSNLSTLTFGVPGVNCAHCKMKIEQAVGNLPGVASVNVDVDARQAVVKLVSPPSRIDIEALLAEIGYPPESE